MTSSLDKFLNKKYKTERHENLDAILIEMGEQVPYKKETLII